MLAHCTRRTLPSLRNLPKFTSTIPACYISREAAAFETNTMPILTAYPPPPLSMAPSRQIEVQTCWETLEDQPMTTKNMHALILNTIPTIRQKDFLSTRECGQLVEIIKTHQIGTYNQKVVFPPVGSVGITQFDHQHDKDKYFNGVPKARELQERFKREAGIDVLGRVAQTLQAATGLPVRIAKEGDREYFAGLLRVVGNDSVQIHPDYAPYDGPEWEIGRISAQLTWNILLRQVPGGDTIIYDRQWCGDADDVIFRKKFPRYAYSPKGLEGRIFKVLEAVEGDLTFFNPRNFHEVKPCDRALDQPSGELRYTISSFVGLLSETSLHGPSLILWS